MDLEQFYTADPRRRHSEELEFGRDWTAESGRCEVSWVAETGEVYVMAEPRGGLVSDSFGDTMVPPVSEHQLVIEVIGIVQGRDAITAVMSGWEEAMGDENSIAWVRARVAGAATERGDAPAQPSYDLPAD